ncbi:MAG: YggS family pyridoxal phosphate-dependent enzyme, partial [Clostridiales bacterium]|nr:YggS family pyridoxal phosphate-dependent enzyme [Clostridiales bacterium]
WHLIGHLQTNKVKYIIEKAAMIQSLDSWRLAEEIQKRAAACGRVMPVLAQVNIADDEKKFGLSAYETEGFLRRVATLPNLRVEGLMTIGPYCQNAEEIRPVFAQLKALFEELKRKDIPGVAMRRLSMGMSHDYAVAVEEGANIVRVGSAIFY